MLVISAAARLCGTKYERPWSLFALIDVVPHIAARETHERSLGFSVISQKAIFQHNRRIADIPAPGSLRAAHAAIQTAATKTSIGRGWSIT
jgi:hypothetical protein